MVTVTTKVNDDRTVDVRVVDDDKTYHLSSCHLTTVDVDYDQKHGICRGINLKFVSTEQMQKDARYTSKSI